MRKTSEVCLKYWNKGLVHPPGFPLQKGGGLADLSKCGCSSVVEFQLPKLVMWVRLPSLAPRGQQKAPLPLFSFSLSPGVYPGAHAGVAQLVEHLLCKQVARGSSPRISTILSGCCPTVRRMVWDHGIAGSTPVTRTRGLSPSHLFSFLNDGWPGLNWLASRPPSGDEKAKKISVDLYSRKDRFCGFSF